MITHRRALVLSALLSACGGDNPPVRDASLPAPDGGVAADSGFAPDAAAPEPGACIDTEGPSRPGRPALSIEGGAVELRWAASEDPSGVASYRIFRDGLFLSEQAGTSALDESSPVPGSTHAYWLEAVDSAGNVSPRGPGASIAIPPGETGTDDGRDENGDGWLESSFGFRIRDGHPRVITTAEDLETIIARMHGPEAREPYATWFAEELAASERHPLVSALAFRATGDPQYLAEAAAAIDAGASGGGLRFEVLAAVDLVFDDLPAASLQRVRQWAASSPHLFGYNTWSFAEGAVEDPQARFMNNQHALGQARSGLLYAGIFAFTEADAVPMDTPFPTLTYLRAVQNNTQPEGWLWRNENHISGDLELHPERLPGHPGGMFDNFGYDSAEESNSIWIWELWRNLSGQPRHRGAYHDEYRGHFWLANRVPHSETANSEDLPYSFCTDNLARGRNVRPWSPTQASHSSPLSTTTALLARNYQDPIAQYYAAERACSGEWNATNLFSLFHFDATLSPVDPTTLPRAHYFPGPGTVTSRSSWSSMGTLAVLYGGVGYGRRYEDASSFLLHRRGPIVVHASKRARGGVHSGESFWFHVRGASKNGVRIFDPEERRCNDPEASLLVASDALGGPLFERGPYAEVDGTYSLAGGTPCPATERLDPHVDFVRSAEVLRFEDGGDYTYALVDAAHPYRSKAELFERALVHAGDDAVIIFDRLRLRNPEARRVWAAHFAPDPIPADAIQNFGWLNYGGADAVRFSGDDEVAAHVLLPEIHETRVRGGDTVLWSGTLEASSSYEGSHSIESPRWLLLRSASAATIRVRGRGGDGSIIDEVVDVSVAVRDERGGVAGNTVARFAELLSLEAIEGPAEFSVEIPHRFDVEDINGTVRDFEPGRSAEGREARPDDRSFGRHTLEIEAPAGDTSSNFLVGLSLADAGVEPIPFEGRTGDNLAAAIRGSSAWVFVLERSRAPGSIALPAGLTEVHVLGLPKMAQFEVDWGDELRLFPDGTPTHCTSAAGTLALRRG